jgi:hypothetical protein
MTATTVTIDNRDYTAYRVNNDYYGNPRYVIHYLELDLPGYYSTKKTRAAGLKIYYGNDFGGGFVFQSYNVLHSLAYIVNTLKS